MPVDKFGRRYDVVPSSNISNVLRSGDTMEGDLNMNGNRIAGLPSNLPPSGTDAVSWSNVVNLVRDSERESASKVSRTGDVMTGNLLLSAYDDSNRIIGCTDLVIDNSFSILLGTSRNKLYFVFKHQEPVTLQTNHGFLVKAGNDDVCRLGTADDSPEIVFHKVIRMNSNRITNLPEPILPHEVANKIYVDTCPRKILNGYIPTLKSFARGISFKSGFAVSASSQNGARFKAENVFNNYYVSGRGASGEWATNGETENFWLQIKCPDLVRVWKVALRGRDLNTQRIYSWRIEGSTDGENYTSLFEAPNPTYLGNELQQFSIDTNNKFNFYRLYCLEAEPTNP